MRALAPQCIRPLTDRRFQILYPGEGFRLIVDFSPIIEAEKLTVDYALVHWQARPRGQRRWGIYSPGSYQSVVAYRAMGLESEGIQLDELGLRTVPSAVVLYRDCRVRVEGETAIIEAL